MAFIVCMFFVGVIMGLAGVASNPSPYFGAFSLIVGAGMGCGVLANYGASFLSLALFLIYLGGMLVVFAYSAALAAEPYPESWGSWAVFWQTLLYVLGVIVGFLFWGMPLYAVWGMEFDEDGDLFFFRGDMEGLSLIYSDGGVMLILAALALLLTLFVVLELTRGLNRGALRAV